jgi:hypothetical protein
MRTVLTGGVIPSRARIEGELRVLREAAAAARRTFEERHNHHNEIALAQADQRVIDFLLEHPELVEITRLCELCGEPRHVGKLCSEARP